MVARADLVRRAVEAATAPSVLESTAVFSDELDSDSRVAAVGAVSTSFAVVLAAAPAPPSDALAALAAAQDADGTVLDAQCGGAAALAAADGSRYGARLATDGDASTYWLSVGEDDAVLTVDLGSRRPVSGATFVGVGGALGARDVHLVARRRRRMARRRVGATREVPPTTLALSAGGANGASAGVMARYLRFYMADAANLRVSPRGVEPLASQSRTIDSGQTSLSGRELDPCFVGADGWQVCSTDARDFHIEDGAIGGSGCHWCTNFESYPEIEYSTTASSDPEHRTAELARWYVAVSEGNWLRLVCVDVVSDGTTVTIDVTCAKHMKKSVLIDNGFPDLNKDSSTKRFKNPVESIDLNALIATGGLGSTQVGDNGYQLVEMTYSVRPVGCSHADVYKGYASTAGNGKRCQRWDSCSYGVGCSLADAPHKLPFGAEARAQLLPLVCVCCRGRGGVLHRRSRRRVAALHPDPKLHQRHPDGRSPPCGREAPSVLAEGSGLSLALRCARSLSHRASCRERRAPGQTRSRTAATPRRW